MNPRRAGVLAATVAVLAALTPGVAAAAPIRVGPLFGGFDAQALLNLRFREAGLAPTVACEPQFWRVNSIQNENMVMDASRRSENRGQIISHPWNGGASQQWAICRTNPGAPEAEVYLIARDSGKCVELRGNADQEDAPFVEGACHAGDSQRFWLAREPVTGTTAFQVKSHGGRFMNGFPYFNTTWIQRRNEATLHRLMPLS